MRRSVFLIFFALAAFLLGSAVDAKKPRKLPVGSYISSAKIEILSDDEDRQNSAIALLDSLFMHYGPHAEALSLMASIYVDKMEAQSSPNKQKPFVVKLIAYSDSLQLCCDNKDVKKKYRKKCDDYTEKSDSTLVKYWRQFYNAGIEQLNVVGELLTDLESQSDSSTIEYTNEAIKENIDSCIINLELSILIEPNNHLGFIAMGNVYENKKDYEEAIVWYQKGLEGSEDRNISLVQSIAYDYISLDQYCDAVPYFNEMVVADPDDFSTARNLVICLNNCNMYDSALVINHMLVRREPDDPSSYSNIGRYFNQMAREASDSARTYSDETEAASKKKWTDKRTEAFDSSKVYFAKVFELDTENSGGAADYGMVCYLLNDFENAALAFARLAELEPTDVDTWTTLGDCHFQLKQWPLAARAYEKVIELAPNNKLTLEQLSFLYNEMGETALKKTIDDMLSKL